MENKIWRRPLPAMVAVTALAAAPSWVDGAADASAADEPIVVGAMVEISGPGAESGQTLQRALQLMVESTNEQGGIAGRPVELDLRDTESSPDTAAEIAREFVREEVQVIFGPGPASLCGAASAVTERAEVVLWCMTPVGEAMPHTFRIDLPVGLYLGDVPGKFIHEQGWERVACLHTTDGSGEAYLGALEAASERWGFEVVAVESFENGSADVTAQLTRIRGEDPDVIYSCASAGNHPTVFRGMQQLNMTQPVFAGIGGVTYSVAELSADVLPEGGVYTNGNTMLAIDQLPEDLPGRDLAIEFAETYNAEYPDPPDHFAAWAADAFNIVAGILEDDPDASGPDIAQAIESVTDYQGITGRYSFSPEDHQGLQPDFVLIVRWTEDGRFELETVLDEEGLTEVSD